MYSALKVAMAADQSSNIASTWKKMYSYQREENYDQNVFVENIEDNEDGAIGESLISIKMKKCHVKSIGYDGTFFHFGRGAKYALNRRIFCRW